MIRPVLSCLRSKRATPDQKEKQKCLRSSIGGAAHNYDRFEFIRHLGSLIPSSEVQVHAGYVRVSIIHRTLTWTTGSLTCVHGLSYACVYTRGWVGTPTASQHNLFDSQNLSFSCAPDGVRTLDHCISSPTLLPVSQPVTPEGELNALEGQEEYGHIRATHGRQNN